MLRHIKLLNYKGIKTVRLENLGHINVICGKNSSGKSSILEALTSEKNYSIGNIFKNPETIIDAFFAQANKYSSPSPQKAVEMITMAANKYAERNIVTYTDDSDDFAKFMAAEQDSFPYFKQWSNVYNYKALFKDIVKKEIDEETFILIPPKRILLPKTNIDLNENLESSGSGCVNQLFYLKNQHTQSTEFKKYMNIGDQFKAITGYMFNIVPDKNGNFLRLLFSINNEWRDAEDCGLGLRDVLVMLTFIISTDYNCYLIEEPENHLHADFQKRLLRFFRKLTTKQFLLSTHSNVFLDSNNVDKIFYSWFDKEVKTSDETSMSKMVSSLGYSLSENLTSDAIILVEGPKDIPVIVALLKWLEYYEKYNIRLWPLGGDIMGELDLSFFDNRPHVYAIIDEDPGSSAVRKKFLASCKNNDIECFRLKRYAIENYFTIDAIKKVFPDAGIQNLEIKSDQNVDQQIGFKSKGRTIKAKNYEIIEQMSLTDFEGTDLLKHLRKIGAAIDLKYQSKLV